MYISSSKNLITHHISGLTFASSIPVALITPFVINTIGIRATMGISSILYSGLFIGIIFMKTWTIYLGSVITGKINDGQTCNIRIGHYLLVALL